MVIIEICIYRDIFVYIDMQIDKWIKKNKKKNKKKNIHYADSSDGYFMLYFIRIIIFYLFY